MFEATESANKARSLEIDVIGANCGRSPAEGPNASAKPYKTSTNQLGCFEIATITRYHPQAKPGNPVGHERKTRVGARKGMATTNVDHAKDWRWVARSLRLISNGGSFPTVVP